MYQAEKEIRMYPLNGDEQEYKRACVESDTVFRFFQPYLGIEFWDTSCAPIIGTFEGDVEDLLPKANATGCGHYIPQGAMVSGDINLLRYPSH